MIRTLAALLLPTSALAQAADTTAMQSSPILSILPLVLIFFVFYFLLIRPQQRRLKEHATMQEALKKGDQVITGGGVAGKIVRVIDEQMVGVEIAPGVEVKVVKSTISSVVGKNTVPSMPDKKKKPDSMVKNDNVVVSKEDIANDN